MNSLSRRAALVGASAVAGSVASLTAITATRPAAVDTFAALTLRWREGQAAINAHPSDDSIWGLVDARVPPPETLRALPGDQELGFTPPYCERPHYHSCDVSQFRKRLCRPSEILEGEEAEGLRVTLIRSGLPWPEKQKRADEIIACFDEWDPQREALADELGAYEAAADFDELVGELNEIERQIAATPVTSISEAVAKARLVAEILTRYEHDLCSNPEETMAMNLVRDLAKLAVA